MFWKMFRINDGAGSSTSLNVFTVMATNKFSIIYSVFTISTKHLINKTLYFSLYLYVLQKYIKYTVL